MGEQKLREQQLFIEICTFKGMNQYKNLRIWQNAMDLVVRVYAVTHDFPDSEKYGLISQLRRCAVSIPSNIAEGARRNGQKEFYHFLGIAKGSLAELETQLEISFRLKFKLDEDYDKLLSQTDSLGRMISKLQSSIKASDYPNISESPEFYQIAED